MENGYVVEDISSCFDHYTYSNIFQHTGVSRAVRRLSQVLLVAARLMLQYIFYFTFSVY